MLIKLFLAFALIVPSVSMAAGLPTGTVQRIAFGSCSNQYLEQPIWNTIVQSQPDLFLHLGDIIYGDAAPPGKLQIPESVDLIEKMKMDYAFFADKPEFKNLKQTIPIMATWDDHDYGKNDGGEEFQRKEESRQLFLDFLEVPNNSPIRKTPGIYDAKFFGPPGERVQIIMLDTRYFRDALIKSTLTKEQAKSMNIVGRYVANQDKNATLLGKQQWQWLEEQLRKPAEVRLLVSSITVVANERGSEGWGNFPHERKRLFDLIKKIGANGIIILSGDVHFSEISRTEEGSYPLYDFTSSPLRQYGVGMTGWESTVNSMRISETFAKDNLGLVEIDWRAKPTPVITLKAIGEDGSVGFEHKVPLSSLQAFKLK